VFDSIGVVVEGCGPIEQGMAIPFWLSDSGGHGGGFRLLDGFGAFVAVALMVIVTAFGHNDGDTWR
jgi:hypothetical protein